jgi:hypothetical protein
MGKPLSACLMLCALILTAPVHAVIEPNKVQVFKDWAVGCDNGGACEALPLASENGAIENMALVFRRDLNAKAMPRISISGFVSTSDRYTLLVDSKVVDTGAILPGDAPIELTGKDANKLVSAIRRGKSIRLIDGAGKKLGQASLSGATNALQYIDKIQRPVTKKAGRFVVPTVTVPRIMPSDKIPDTGSLVALAEGSSCAKDRVDVTQDTAYSLGNSGKGPSALALISCGNGAYNFSTAVFVGTQDPGGKWTFEPARFDYGPAQKNGAGDLAVLINSGWDSATQSINSYSKFRGLADCGRSETYVWDGSMFRLTNASAMDVCRGAGDWITVWRAEVKRAG